MPKRRNRSDFYFRHLARLGTLDRLVQHLLPGRSLEREANTVTNHDERAALVCALTALCAAGSYVVVGDEDGRIVLPPVQFIQPWAHEILQRNTAGGDWLKQIGPSDTME